MFKALFSKNQVSKGSSININGMSFSGQNISITSSGVFVDGVKQEGVSVNQPKINVSIVGDCESISTVNGDCYVTGNVGGNVQTTNGDITAGKVMGSVKTTNGDVSYVK